MKKLKIKLTLEWEGELDASTVELMKVSYEDAMEELILLATGREGLLLLQEYDEDERPTILTNLDDGA